MWVLWVTQQVEPNVMCSCEVTDLKMFCACVKYDLLKNYVEFSRGRYMIQQSK
jgi:hypothetical protein